MTSNKSILILKKFDDEKLKSFHLFLESAYYNNRKSLLELYDCLLIYKPHYEIKVNELYKLHPKILSDKFSDDKYIIKIFSFLYKELEKFIVVEENTSNFLKSKTTLLEFYNSHDIIDLYQDTLRDIKTKVKSEEDISIYNFVINDLECNYQSKNDNRKGDINYENLYNSIELFYHYQKYKALCLMINRNQIIPHNYELLITEHNTISNKLVLSNKFVYLFYSLYQIIIDPSNSQELFYSFKKYIDSIHQIIDKEDLSITYVILSNYIKQIFKNKDQYFQELLDLYKRQIELGSFYINGKLHVSYLNNIIKVFILNKEYDNALAFLNKNKNFIIPEDEAAESFHYLLSQIYFAKEDYHEALANLSKTKSNDNLIKLAIKRLYLKIFLEMEELNTFDSFTNSYKVFLSRDESLTKEKKEIEKNFVNSMILINRYRLDKNYKKLQNLKSKIASENISEQTYLLKKIEDYLK